jgi:hypothetical protein
MMRGMFLGALVVLAFGLGLYLGGLIHTRKVERLNALNTQCLERMSDVTSMLSRLRHEITEVNNERLLLGSRGMQAWFKPGLQGVSEGEN